MIIKDQSSLDCPICNRVMKATGQTLYDDRYGYPGIFPIFTCKHCGHASLLAKFSADELTELYSNYYPRTAIDVKNHVVPKECSGFKAWIDGLHCKAFRWVPRSVSVLDIGCGFGETLGYHQNRGCDVYGVEADQNIQRVANEFGYKVQVGLFNSDNYKEAYFDYVTLDQVIEHVTDPNTMLRGIERVLKSGGVIIITTPNLSGWGARLFGRYWINWHAPYHLHHFSVESMQASAFQAGLILDSSRTITSSDWLYYQWIHMFTFPKEKTPSLFWLSSNNMPIHHKIIIVTLRFIHKLGINHVLTRFFDILGMGDSRIYFLRKP